MALTGPTRAFAKGPLSVIEIVPSRLIRISRHATGEPFFGKGGVNRFDDYRLPMARRFGTCYCGLTLRVAFAETVLHDELPVAGQFAIAAETLESRYVVEFRGEPLRLADLTGVALKRSGIDSSIATTGHLNLAQKWAVAIQRHPAAVDGILYMSRHMNSEQAVALFDRSSSRIRALHYTTLTDFPGAMRTLKTFGVISA